MPNIQKKSDTNTLPVDRRAMIKTLYQTIGRNVFGVPEDRIEWMMGFIDQHMTDREIDMEWDSIQKGNVQKFIKLFQKIQQNPQGHEDKIEQLQRMHEDIVDGMMQYKQRGMEIEPESFKAVEQLLVDFADEMLDEMENGPKKLASPKKNKLLGALDAQKHWMLAVVLSMTSSNEEIGTIQRDPWRVVTEDGREFHLKELDDAGIYLTEGPVSFYTDEKDQAYGLKALAL